MRTGNRPHRGLPPLVIALSLIFCLGLALLLNNQPGQADSGGFPTPLPTWTPIVIPTQAPTASPTFIVIPTQNSAALESSSAQKSLQDTQSLSAEANSASVETANGGLDWGSLFLMGLMIGLVVLLVIGMVYWFMRRTGRLV